MGNKQSERKPHTRPHPQPRSLDKIQIHDSIEIDFSGRLSYRDDGKAVYLIDHTARSIVEIELSDLYRQRVIVERTMDSLPWCVKYFSNRLYVSDTFQNTLTMYDTEGKLMCRIDGNKLKLNALSNPRDICTDYRGLLYLCDNGNNRILVLTADLYLVTTVNVPFPSDVIINPKEFLVYSSELNSVIVVNEEGVKSYPLSKYTFDKCNKICTDGRGNILFLGLSRGIIVVDPIEIRILRILIDRETKYLNYITNHARRNTITVLTKENGADRHQCAFLRNIYI